MNNFNKNPSNDEDGSDDEDDDVLDSIQNWPPSRGAIDPFTPRSTYMPSIIRDYDFKVQREQNNIKGATGEWLNPYRVSAVRSLNVEQANRILLVHSTKQNREWWNFDRKNKKFPTFYVDFKEIPTMVGSVKLERPYRFLIGAVKVKRVFTNSKGKVRKTTEKLEMSHGYFLYALAKELERNYQKIGMSDFNNLFFDKLQVRSNGEVKVSYKFNNYPKEVSLVIPEIIRQEFEVVRQEFEEMENIATPEPKLSRANARKLRACSVLSEDEGDGWETFYSVAQVATLTLEQANELLTVSKSSIEVIKKGHPLFNRYQEKEIRAQRLEIPNDYFMQEEEEEDYESHLEQEIRSSLEIADLESEESEQPEELDEDEEVSMRVRFRCPHCGAWNKKQGKFIYSQNIKLIDKKPYREVSCNNCQKSWWEPQIEMYIRRFKSVVFDFWNKCRNEDAATLVVDISYPLEKIVRLTIPPLEYRTELGNYRVMSPGYFMWILAKEYQRIYKNHEEYRIWGHNINDLNIESIQIKPNGKADIFIGS